MAVCLNNDKYSGYFKYVRYDRGSESAAYGFDADFDWFLQNSAFTYNDNIADLSIKGAMAAFALDDWDYEKDKNGNTLVDIYRNPIHYDESSDDIEKRKSQNIQRFMEALEFENLDINYAEPEMNTIGYAIGSRTISNGSKTATLIFVPIRGAGYTREWGGNLQVGLDTISDHDGFSRAAEQVIDGINNYVDEHKSEFEDEIIIWTVGYSRAAATANLVAARLDNGAVEGIGRNNIYAYCFECPQNTVNSNYDGEKYKNIFSIVNPVDLVPTVAPTQDWGFHRFGVTYVIPSNTNYPGYKNLNQQMKTKYRNILHEAGNNLSDDEFNILVSPYKNQQQFIEKTVGALISLIGSRDRYALLDQLTVTELASKETDFDDIGPTVFFELATRILDSKFINTSLLAKVKRHIKFLNAILPFVSALQDAGLDEHHYFMDIDQYIVNWPYDPSGTFDFTIDIIKAMGQVLFRGHYPELCLAWMETLSADEVMAGKRAEMVYINCPVDVVVKDSTGNVVAKIADNEAADIEEGLSAYIDSNGQKIVIVPAGGNYSIEVSQNPELADIGGDSDELTLTFMECEGESNIPSKLVSYTELPLANGNIYKAGINDGTVSATNPANNTISPDISLTGDIPKYSVTVDVIGDGNVVSEDSYYIGEYAELKAYSARSMNEAQKSVVGSDFIGWFNENDDENAEPISTDESYRFLVNGDVHLVARFKDLTGVLWAYGIDESGYDYTGAAIKPQVNVYNGKTLLSDKTDYTVSYANNTNVYTLKEGDEGFDKKKAPAVIITGKGNYKDKEYIYFTINPKSIEDEDITVSDIEPVLEKTSAQKPVPIVKWGKKALANKKDFAVSYYKSYNSETGELSELVAGPDADSKTGPQAAGEYYVCIEGKGCYTGRVVKKFRIGAGSQKLITKLTLTKIKDKDYSGENNYLKDDEISKLLKDGTYYLKAGNTQEDDCDYVISYSPENPVDAGIVTVTLTAKNGGKYVGSRTATYKIKATPLSKAKMNKLETKLDYAGGEGVIQHDSDKFFYIESGRGATYMKTDLKGMEAAEYAAMDEGTEKRKIDYTYAYTNNIYPGKATVVFTGVNKYEGTIKKDFTINGIALSKAYLDPGTFDANSIVYDGTAKTQNAVFYTAKGSGVTLKEGTDYTVTYQKNTDAGTATVIYKGAGGYTGEVKKTFKINQFDIIDPATKLLKGENIIIEIENADDIEIVKGGAKPDVTVKFITGVGENAKEVVLKEKTDYTVVYGKNSAVYTAALGDLSVDSKKAPSVTVTMKGNFKNKAVKYFNIKPKSLESSDIKVTVNDAVYKTTAGAWKMVPTLTDSDGKKLAAGTDYSKNIVYRYGSIPEGAKIYNGKIGEAYDVTSERHSGDIVDSKDIVPAGVTIKMEIASGTGTFYTGTRTSDTYRIVAKDIAKANATVLVAKEYTGKEITLDPLTDLKLTDGSGKNAVILEYAYEEQSGDYRIVPGSYKNNILKGKATVEIEGRNNYGGRKTITFTIGQKGFLWWWRNLLQ